MENMTGTYTERKIITINEICGDEDIQTILFVDSIDAIREIRSKFRGIYETNSLIFVNGALFRARENPGQIMRMINQA